MIRDARLDDLDSLEELEQLSFETDRFHRGQLRYLLTKAQGKILVYEKAGQVWGALILSWRRNSSVARITSVAVRPEYHKHGIGTILVSHAETIAKDRGLKKINLEVRQDNKKAISFYEDCGYTRVGLKAAYYCDGMDGISYRKLL
jgi:[ribosomal protein S18]-alanine N-acetyltransferase